MFHTRFYSLIRISLGRLVSPHNPLYCVRQVSGIAGGTGLIVLVPRTARIASAWTGVMLGLWVVFLHVPRAWPPLDLKRETSGQRYLKHLPCPASRSSWREAC